MQEAFLGISKKKLYDPYKYEGQFDFTDCIALEYKTADDKRRGEIALFFVKRFENLVKKKIGKFNATQKQSMRSYYKEEGLAIWSMHVCKRLDEWDGSQSKKYDFLHFLAYLKPVADKQVTSDLQEKYAWKDGKYTTTDELSGNADSYNGTFDNMRAFQAYEAHLIGHAFPFNGSPVEQGDFASVMNNNDAHHLAKDIDGIYDPRNHNQWDMYDNGIIEEDK